MKYCTKCRAENADSAKFCTNCGATCEVISKKSRQKINYSYSINKEGIRAIKDMNFLLALLILIIFVGIYMGYRNNDGYDIESVINQVVNDPEELIVGRWSSSEPDHGSPFYSDVEFFSDGTHITESQSWSGTYTIDGDRLAINGRWYSDVYTFEFRSDGDELIIYSDEGYSRTYERVD